MSTESDTPEVTPEVPQPVAEPEQPASSPPAAPPQQAFDPRRRLRELLAIPERDRTDPQWDEINELEIQLAPGNRVHPGSQGTGAGGIPGGGGGGGRHFQQKKHPSKGGGGGDKGSGGGGKRRPRPGNPNKPQ